jgi:hypothetical protein
MAQAPGLCRFFLGVPSNSVVIFLAMVKVDLKKELKHLYQASAQEPVIVEVPAFNFLMLDGAGDPNGSPQFQEAAEALFSVAYNLKFRVKKAQGVDYGVLPLEGLWYADELADFREDHKEAWKWTLMILQPEFISSNTVRLALEEVAAKKNLAALDRLKFLRYREGLAAQVLHLGPYGEEGPAVARLHAFIQAKGGELRGKHHEIYLSDPRRTAPERLKTILRQPFA